LTKKCEGDKVKSDYDFPIKLILNRKFFLKMYKKGSMLYC